MLPVLCSCGFFLRFCKISIKRIIYHIVKEICLVVVWIVTEKFLRVSHMEASV